MNDTVHKPHAPSKSRLAFAASSGFFIHSPILIFGCVLVCISSVGLLFPYSPETVFSFFLRNAIQSSAHEEALLNGARTLFLCTGILFVVLLPIPFGAVWMVRRQKRQGGQSNVSVPESIPQLQELKENLLVGTLCMGLIIPISIVIVRAAGFTYSEIASSPSLTATRFIDTFFWITLTSGAVAIVGGILQLSLYKARLFKHLSLTTMELEKEQQLHGHSKTKQQLQRNK